MSPGTVILWCVAVIAILVALAILIGVVLFACNEGRLRGYSS